MSEWKEVEIKDVSEYLTVGFVGSMSNLFMDSGIPLLRGQNILPYRLDLSNLKFISEETHSKWSKSELKAGDVVLVRVGEPGTACVIPENSGLLNAASLVIVRPDKKKLDSNFLCYFLNSRIGKTQISNNIVGSVQQVLNVSTAARIKIDIPEIKEQKTIAHILGTLDYKIELNRKMNQTLEAMAQALFKSWFVDFDPVMDNALTEGNEIPDELHAMAEKRQLVPDSKKLLIKNPVLASKFPSSFVFNEKLGKWIPEGWDVNEIKKITKPIKDNKKPNEILNTDIYVGLEHIQRKSLFLSENGFGSDIKSNKSAFLKGDILFGKLRPYFHKICIAPTNGVCSTDILIFRASKIEFSSFLTYFLFQEELVEYVNKRSTGTRMPRANQKDILSYKFALPKDQILISFENLIRPATEKALRNIEENRTLTQLRDRLLPELISGKVRVSETTPN